MLRRLERWAKTRLHRHPRLYGWARRLKLGLLARRPAALRGGHWDRMVGAVESGAHKGWLDYEFVEVEHVRPQVSGDPNVYYLGHFFDTHVPERPIARALSLGCGGGNLERALIEMGTAERIDAYDSSPESIKLAERLAAEAGIGDRIAYRVADIDAIELPEGVYGYAIAKMALHHFENLEHVYAQIRRALAPDGVFMFNEFVGPSRFQWTDLQLRLMNEVLATMPAELRERAGAAEIVRPTVEEMIALDPTESVRSAEILPLLERDFEIVEMKPYGGTLLHMLLAKVMHVFDLDDPEHRAWLRLLLHHERTLIEQGVLPSDFAYVVARPRPAA